jgi:hypothetical protein
MSAGGTYANSDADHDVYADTDSNTAALRRQLVPDLQRHMPGRPAVLPGLAGWRLLVHRPGASAV